MKIITRKSAIKIVTAMLMNEIEKESDEKPIFTNEDISDIYSDINVNSNAALMEILEHKCIVIDDNNLN